MSQDESIDRNFIQTSSSLNKDDFSDGPIKLQSYCMNCGSQNGETRLLLTDIPHFREVILSSFSCPDCHWRNHEVQFGGTYGEKGVEINLQVKNKEDLNRQVVKSDFCTIIIPEIEFEIPPESQKGSLNTIEGVISKAIDDLKQEQPVRRYMQPEIYYKIEDVIEKLQNLINLDSPFTLRLEDPSGNSNVENIFAPQSDPQMKLRLFNRTRDQNRTIGLTGLVDDLDDQEYKEKHKQKPQKVAQPSVLSGEEAERFASDYIKTSSDIERIPQECPNCGKMTENRFVVCNIPHFQEVVIMALSCDHCGFKTNEVKPGGSISEKGRKIVLKVETEEDLNRDLLKSDSCSLEIPEIDLHVSEGTLGGKFTTIEGILTAVKEQLFSMGQFSLGDSSITSHKMNFNEFLSKIEDLASGKILPFTLIVDDPLANSYIQNIYAPDPDPNMEVTDYKRSFEQDEDLGLHDIRV